MYKCKSAVKTFCENYLILQKKDTLRISSQTMKQECWWSGHLIYPWENLPRNEHSYYKKSIKNARSVTFDFRLVNALDIPFRAQNINDSPTLTGIPKL